MSFWRNQLSGPTDPARDAAWDNPPERKGFFTDTSICIGCKACEVACKEWNQLPEDGLTMLGSSYDNTGALGASTWRHVTFVEQSADRIEQARESGRRLVGLGMPSVGAPPSGSSIAAPGGGCGSGAGMGTAAGGGCGSAAGGCCSEVATVPLSGESSAAPEIPVADFRWLIASDVCKHCTHAACLDVCPTGSLFRSEFGTVVVQDDVCNGCGYCVAACPFGVIERRTRPVDPDGAPVTVAVKNEGIAQKCTLCYDRLGVGQRPACAQACPTTSIQFGDLSEMRRQAEERVATLHAQGYTEARVYGGNPNDGVGGTGSIFLLMDEPEVYGLPPDPRVTTADLPEIFRVAGRAGLMMLAGAALCFLGGRRD